LNDVSPLDLKSPSPDESAMRQEEESRLRDAVAALPEREAAVFALRYFESLDLPEIADCLGISYSAAGAALSRARTKLTLIFSEMGTEKSDGRQKSTAKLPFSLGRTQPGLA
jgi:RNA polymerase sigma factor (sigma-70 family)